MSKITKKIAICYFGMTRSTKYIYQSHKENLYQILQQNNMEYDTYMHTWETSENIIWNKSVNIPIDYNEYKLLDINFYKIEKQNDFLQNINMDEYCNVELYTKYGGYTEHEWIPELIRNHLCALESQKRVYTMVMNSEIEYDFVIFIRPDVLITNKFDINWLSYFQNEDTNIIILDYDHYEGLNDKFSILPYHSASKYACRIDEIIEFRKQRGRIVSEKYVKYIVDKYYPKVKFIHFCMNIIRPIATPPIENKNKHIQTRNIIRGLFSDCKRKY